MSAMSDQTRQSGANVDVLSSFDVSRATWPVESIGLDVIRTVVDSFYETIRSDPLLAPIFRDHIADWPKHLATMYRFWSTIVNFTGQYSGNPLAVHARLPHLAEAHFVRWLELWSATVEQFVPAADQSRFVHPAVRVARRMMAVCLPSAC